MKIFWCKNCLNMSTRPRIEFDNDKNVKLHDKISKKIILTKKCGFKIMLALRCNNLVILIL